MNIELKPIATLVIKTYEFEITTLVNRYIGRVEVRKLDDNSPPRYFFEIDSPDSYTDAEQSALETIISQAIVI
jgi:hypothetical protein